jgi:C4-dicarboxylate transporter DctM subunit
VTVAVLFALFVFLFLLGVPISFSLLIASTVSFLLFFPQSPSVLAQQVFSNVDSFPLMAVVFFMLASRIMAAGGVSRRIVNLANAIVGGAPGGLALASLVACVFFASVSGSSLATVAAVGSMVIPAMQERGYSNTFAVGSVVCAGTLGIVIPPSIPMIIYGFVTGTSVPRLFLAGIVPGLLLAALLASVTLVGARRRNYRGLEGVSGQQRWEWIKGGLWTLLIPFVIFVGIYGLPAFTIGPVHFAGGGIFTPTEASIVTVLASLVVGGLIYRELTWQGLLHAVIDAERRTGSIFFIITGAMLFGFILNNDRVPQTLASWIVGMHMPVWVFLLAVNVLLFFAGDFMDAAPIILIFMPVLFPAAQALGVDPVQFGVMVAVNMEMGAITPPIGMNLFMASQITGLDLYQVLRASAPWILVVVLVVLLVTYIPGLSLWLPNAVLGRGG